MRRKESTVEVLAPAGSFESLTAAIQAGADAVYFGIEQLNMRARSANLFTLTDLDAIVLQCNQANVKAYLTLNTILYDHDMQLMRRIMDGAKRSGIHGVIVSDHAAMAYGKQIGIPLHISTQANVSNIETVEFFTAFADVIVLARELNLKQVADIVREINRRKITGPSGKLVRIEIFAHGALCMAISGKCYLSLHTQFASANRGACIQNCRRPYMVTDKEDGYEFEVDNEYIMSAKDLCTIDILDEIMNTGVCVLKIEGRGRSADYVYATTKCYKEAVQSVMDHSYSEDKIEGWKTELSKVYNRGFWEGYYLGRKLGEWTNKPGSVATERKIYVGRGNRYYPKLKVGEFQIDADRLKVGDDIMILSRQEGLHKLTIAELRVNGTPVHEAVKGDVISFPCASKIFEGDKVYKIVAESR
ncbi:MAG: peptidase U32 family protein [Cyclobacteriaceae bacterium]